MRNKVVLAVAGLLCSHSPGIFAQPLCTAGQLDRNFGAAHTGYVQISPVLTNYPNSISGESEVLDPSGESYSVSTAAADSVGYGVADIVKVKPDGARDWSFGGFGSVVLPPPATETGDAAITMDGAGNLIAAIESADYTSVVLYRYSPAGVLDTTYGTAGIATIHVAQLSGPWAIQAAPDGSVLVAVPATTDGSWKWQPMVFKVTPAGTLDTSFGLGGFSYFYTGAFGPRGKATDLRIQSDGTILVGGRVGDNATYNRFFVARLFSNGALDTSFGTSSGMTVVSFGNIIADGRKMALQSDGKIVLVGGVGDNGTGVIRLSDNGVPDSTFNSSGSLYVDGFHGYQVALQSNNKILVAGAAGAAPNPQQTGTTAAVVRVTSSGRLDPTFGPAHNGMVTLAVPGAVSSGTSAISYRPGDGIHVLVAGNDVTGTVYTEYLARLDAGAGILGCH